MAVSPQPRMIAETYHSTLETCLYEGKVVVIKRSRNVHDPRTKERWRNEVEALKIVGTTHVRAFPFLLEKSLICSSIA